MSHFEGYRITSPYGQRTHPIRGGSHFHTGIDMTKSHQAPIHAFVSGKVIWAKWGARGTGYGGFGNVVAIRDSNGYTHMYAHLDSITVREGQDVKQGDVIGKQGATGEVTGSHLHYEVRSSGWGTHVDPVKYLDEYFRPSPRQKLPDRGSHVPKPKEDKKMPLPKCKVYLDGRLLGEGFIFEDRSMFYIRELEGIKYELARPNYWDDATKSVYLRSVE